MINFKFVCLNPPLEFKAFILKQNFLLNIETDEGELMQEVNSLKLSANLNLSLSYLKLQNYFDARDSATEALKFDENNEKAYFRRGQALLSLGEPHLATKDFNEVLRLEPNNKAGQAQLVACQKQIKEQLSREKKIYANMFDKFAKEDTQVN